MAVTTRLLLVGLAVAVSAYGLLGFSQPTGPFAGLAFRNEFVGAALAFLVWLGAVAGLHWIRPQPKALWYPLEQPWVGLLTKLSLIAIVIVAASSSVLELTCTPPVVGVAACSNAAAPVAALLIGGLATVGWNYTAFENRRAEIRRSTMEMINKVMSDAAHERLQAELYIGLSDQDLLAETKLYEEWQTLHRHPLYLHCIAYFSAGKEPAALATDQDKRELTRIRRIYAFGKYCDFLEWLALLTRLGRVDERLAREMLFDSVTIACESLGDFISNARDKDKAFYEHLAWLYEHWTGKRGPLHPS